MLQLMAMASPTDPLSFVINPLTRKFLMYLHMSPQKFIARKTKSREISSLLFLLPLLYHSGAAAG